jgi:RNA polymerase subunit RPABC4/transcription elongation factor Spt4
MADRIDITLSKEQFQYIGSLQDGEKTTASPFHSSETKAPASEEDQKVLMDLGVIAGHNKIHQKYKQTFSQLAKPASFTWVTYGGIGPYSSFIIFFHDAKSISLFETEKSFRIQDPAPTEELLIMLNQYFGTSFFSTSDATEVLSFDEALVLFAVIDLRRRQLLIDILENSPPKPAQMSIDVIADWLSLKKQNYHWFVTRLREYLEPADVLSQETITKGLTQLTKRGLVAEKDGKYLPSKMTEIVSNRFTILGNNLTLYSGRVAEKDEVTHLKVEVIGANLSDLMLWEIVDNDKVHISFPSPLALTFMLSAFLDSPDFIKDIQGKPLKIVKKADELICEKCKMPLSPDSKFCKHCGEVVKGSTKKPEEISCVQCGRKLPADAKFCDGCGKAAE